MYTTTKLNFTACFLFLTLYVWVRTIRLWKGPFAKSRSRDSKLPEISSTFRAISLFKNVATVSIYVPSLFPPSLMEFAWDFSSSIFFSFFSPWQVGKLSFQPRIMPLEFIKPPFLERCTINQVSRESLGSNLKFESRWIVQGGWGYRTITVLEQFWSFIREYTLPVHRQSRAAKFHF